SPDQGIAATGISTSELEGIASVTPGAVTVSPTGLAPTEALGAATAALNVALVGIESSERSGASALSYSVLATGITSVETEGQTTVAPGPVTVTASGI